MWADPLDATHTVTLASSVTYDGNDRAVAATDELGLVSRTEYDRLGRAYKSIDARGNVSVTLYDARGMAVESRSPDGTLTRTAYDSQGRAYLSTDAFVPGQAVPVRGTETVYDAAGRVTATRRREGVVISVTAGRAGPSSGEASVASLGSVLSGSASEYDSAGRAYRSTQFVGVAGAEAVTTTLYDTLGRAVASRDALGHETKTAYDKAGRAVTSWDAAGVPSFTKYDKDGRAVRTTFADGAFTEVGYDRDGRQAFTIDEVGQRTDSGYDALGRLKTVTQPAVVDPATGKMVRPVTTYGYDKQGNRVSITDANGRVTKWEFDEYGRSTGRTLPAVTGEPQASEFTAYDMYGAVDYTVDFAGTKADTVYDYDAGSGLGTKLGRVARVSWTRAGQSQPEQAVSYGYDALGRVDVVSESSAGGTRVTGTDYDAEGRVVKIARPEGVIEYGYDDATGRHVKTWTTASAWEYGYDRLGRLASIAESVRAGVVLGAADRLTTAYGYDLVGMAKSVTVSRGGVAVRSTTNSYDPLRHWLVGVEDKGEGGGTLSGFSYARRADGQVKSLTESVVQPGGGVETGTAKYEYDSLNRLTVESYDGSAAGSDYAKQYTLDLVGNRTELVTANEGQAAVTAVSSYDERDRLLSEVAGGVTTKYGYDPNGSQTTKTVSGLVESTQAWDARGRLASATVAGKSVSYAYTADGVRSGVVQGGVATGYVVDGMNPSGYSQVVEEWSSGANGSPVLVASFTYGAGLDPISTNTDRDGVPGTLESALFIADGHSGVRQAVATAGGAVLLAQRFDAYGVTAAMASVGGFSTPVGYRGERYDATLGQYNLRARLYDPQTGRFTGVDPFGGTYDDPLQSMRYGYAGANPVANSDPSGRFSVGGLAVNIGIGALLGGTINGGLTAYRGGSASDIALSFGRGAVVGGLSAGLGYGLGSIFGFAARGLGASVTLTGLAEIIGGSVVSGAIIGMLDAWIEGRDIYEGAASGAAFGLIAFPLYGIGLGATFRSAGQQGRGVQTGIGRRLMRTIWEDRNTCSQSREFYARWLGRTGHGWSMEHMILKQRWYGRGGPNQWFAPGTRMNKIMQGLGDSGANVLPIPQSLNSWLFRNPAASAGLNYGTYGVAFAGEWLLYDLASQAGEVVAETILGD